MEAKNKFLTAFQQLLKSKPKLLKDSERKELEGLITSLPNDATQLAEAIIPWCPSHSEINNALMQILSDSSKNNRGIAGTFSTTDTQAKDEKNLRETLINALRQSSLPEKPKPRTPQG